MIRQRGESERGHVLDDHRREHSTISEVKGRLSHSLTHSLPCSHVHTAYLLAICDQRRPDRELTVPFEQIGISL